MSFVPNLQILNKKTENFFNKLFVITELQLNIKLPVHPMKPAPFLFVGQNVSNIYFIKTNNIVYISLHL